jgi:hypothetical protein
VRIFDLESLCASEGGEYVLGRKHLHTQGCYLVYGTLAPGEGERLIRPGEGYEEILCAVAGPLILHTDRGEIHLGRSHALHVKQNDTFYLSNPSSESVVYVIAGGKLDPALGL